MLIDFSKYSSVKIGAKHEVSVLNEVCDFRGIIVGNACNLLVGKEAKNLGVLGDNFDYICLDDGVLKVGARTSAKKLYNFAKEHNLAGFELCASVPGSLGGLIKMNAGLKGYAISNFLLSVRTQNGEIFKDDCAFAYRKSGIKGVIFEASFELKSGFDEGLKNDFDEARKNQPKGASFGSIFKNPSGDSAGRLIEAVGLKGRQIGACELSHKHANFLINHGGASFNDALALISLAFNEVKAKFGIELEKEVVILG